jgi:hypothetical protein
LTSVSAGGARLADLAPGRNECWEFFRGNTYTVKTRENKLVVTASGISVNGGDPPHRVKTKRPILQPFVRQELSYVTQKVPGYQVTPTNIDPETVAAAKASEKVALYGYEKWNIENGRAGSRDRRDRRGRGVRVAVLG